MLAEKIDARLAEQAAGEPWVRPFNRPAFPNLRTRELLVALVTQIVETCDHAHMTAPEQEALALGVIRGARTTAEVLGDEPSEVFLADLLDTFVKGGTKAIRELVEVVTGKPLADGTTFPVVNNYEGTPFGLGEA